MKDPQRHRVYMLETIFWANWNEHAEGMYSVVSQKEWEEYCEWLFADGLKNPYYAQRRRSGDRNSPLGWLAEARRATYHASPAWLRMDPSWAPLRNDPRFVTRQVAPVVTCGRSRDGARRYAGP